MKVELDNKNEALLCFLFFLPQMNYYVCGDIKLIWNPDDYTFCLFLPHLNGHIFRFEKSKIPKVFFVVIWNDRCFIIESYR